MCRKSREPIALVRTSDSGYRAWCRSFKEKSETGRPRDPFAQDYHTELMRWELVVQKVLAAAIPDSVDERILFSTQADRKGKVVPIYHELDFVSGTFIEPQLFVEIKIREQSINKKTGWPQLNRSLSIARAQWPNLRGICVNIAIGDLLGTEQECAVSTTPISDLGEAVADLSQHDGATIWLSGTAVAAFAVKQTLLTHGDVQRFPDLRRAVLNPTIVLQSPEARPETNRPGLFDQYRPRP